MKQWKLMKSFCAMSFKQLAEYRMDFLIGLVQVALTQTFGILFLKVVFDNIQELSGWNYNECIMIYGFYLTAFSVEQIFFGNFASLKGYVFEGKFDMILTKPLSPVIYLALLDFDGAAVIQMCAGAGILGYAVWQMGISVHLYTILFILSCLVIGTLFLSAVTIFAASLYFFSEGTFSLFNIVGAVKSFAKYPVSIFGGVLGIFFRFIFPLAVVSYYPTRLLLSGSGREMLLYCTSGLLGMVLLVYLSGRFFYHAARRYQSTGN